MRVYIPTAGGGVWAEYREGLHQHGGLVGQPLLLLDVVAHIAQLLLQHAHRLKVGRVVEGVAPEQQELEVEVVVEMLGERGGVGVVLACSKCLVIEAL